MKAELSVDLLAETDRSVPVSVADQPQPQPQPSPRSWPRSSELAQHYLGACIGPPAQQPELRPIGTSLATLATTGGGATRLPYGLGGGGSIPLDADGNRRKDCISINGNTDAVRVCRICACSHQPNP
jgi:hypothetical protein